MEFGFYRRVAHDKALNGHFTLLHQRADGKPEAVGERELVVDVVGVGVARVRVVPLVRTEPGDDEQRRADDHVRDQHRDPDLERQRRQEREEARRLSDRALEENADAEVHERLREVDDSLAYVADGQRRHGNVRLLPTTTR